MIVTLNFVTQFFYMCNVCCDFRSNCELFIAFVSIQFNRDNSLQKFLPSSSSSSPITFRRQLPFVSICIHRSTWISHWIQTIIRILVLSDSHWHQKHWTITSRNLMDVMGSLLKVSKCSFCFELNYFPSLILV